MRLQEASTTIWRPFYRRGAGRGRGNPPDRQPPPFQNRQLVEPPTGRGRGRIDSPLQPLQPGHTPYLNPLHQLMEV